MQTKLVEWSEHEIVFKMYFSLYKESKFSCSKSKYFLLSTTSNMEFKFKILITKTFNIQNHEGTPVKKMVIRFSIVGQM